MSVQIPKLHVLLGELECNAFHEMNDVSDFIWKSPRLLAHEEELEARKLSVYFPEGGVAAEARRLNEATKLNETFPRLIAMGNLFSAMSVFENYVLLLLKTLQEHLPAVPKDKVRHGVKGHLEGLKAYGAKPYNAQYYEQVCVAIAIRNCLMHAKGLLSVSREAEALKGQVARGAFMDSGARKRRADLSLPAVGDQVSIVTTGLGEQLAITNGYSHLVCFYLREYFCALCGTLNPHTAVRPQVVMIDPREFATKKPYDGPIM